MKLSVVLLLTAFLQISTAATFAQRISLKEDNASLESILNKLVDQTGYNFIYNSVILKNTNKVTVNLKEVDLKKALDACLLNQPLHYTINGNTVVIMSGDEAPERINQQLKTIKGSIKDSEGYPLPGATIKVKNSPLTTISDINGEFVLNNIDNQHVIVITYTGFIAQELAVGNNREFLIVLQEDLAKLNEVVVVGYGTQNRRDVSTSISSVRAEDFADAPVSDFRNALVGRMPGVQVMQPTGNPSDDGAKIRIRGISTITAGSDPLFVIDGIPVEQGLANINPSDIETIDVLKDAASSAIYGSRGANGVVLVTTKKGQADRLSVRYDGYYGTQTVSKKIDMLDAYQFALYAKDGHDGAYLAANPNGSPDDPNDRRPNSWEKNPVELFPYIDGVPGLTNTDWQDAIFRTAPMTNHNISFSGKSNNNINYFSSFNYLKREGIIIGSDIEKLSTRLNLEFNSGKFKFGANLAPSYSTANDIEAEGNWGIVQTALAMPPLWPVYNPDGSFNYQGNGYWRIGNDYQHQNLLNPVAMSLLPSDITNRLALLGRMFAEYEIIPGLNYSFSVGGDYMGANRRTYRPSSLPLLGHQYYNKPSNPTGYNSTGNRYNWLIENKLNYNVSYNDAHNLDVVVVQSAQRNTNMSNNINATNYPNDYVQSISGGIVTDGGSNISEWTLASYLARVQYSYSSKYIASAALRTDGSSRFGANNRWGYFPSASFAWRITEEQFFKNNSKLSFMDDLKLRASYGTTGNFNIGNYDHIAAMNRDDYVLGLSNGIQTNGYAPGGINRPDLKWEKNKTVNVGIDALMLKGFLGFTVEYYNSNTTDMLLTIPVPHITGQSTSLVNIGGVNNQGWEVSLSSKQGFSNGLNYSVSANYASNRNKVTALGPGNPPLISSTSGNSYYITTVGEAIGSYYVLIQDGIFATSEQLKLYPHFDNTQVGDFRFVDVDGDGVMDTDKDRAIAGNYMPKFNYGLNGSLGYKGLDFSFNLQGTYGNTILNNNHRYLSNMEGSVNATLRALNRWRSEEEQGDGHTNGANRKQTGYNTRGSTWHLEDGSYLRLQNISLGYTLPKTLSEKLKTQKLRVYISAQNLWTLTNYSGYNPEVSLRQTSSTAPGEDYGTYPLARIFTTGINILF